MNYKISVFIEGRPGSYQYSVETKDQAMTHFGEIVTKGYRRVNDRQQFEWFAPQMVRYVKIEGDGLQTLYPDTFVRT